MTKVLTINAPLCMGCRLCETVCSVARSGETGIYKSRIRTVRFPDEYFFLPSVCHQCETPACAMVCPSNALSKNQVTGIVEWDEEKCVGCKMCLVSCPFGNIYMVEGKIVKCDLCGGDPMCAKFCRTLALTYEEVEDIGEDKRNAEGIKVKEAAALLPHESRIAP